MHALHSGQDVRAYADSTGRKRGVISNEICAARVAAAVQISGQEDRFSQLVEIHAAPNWLWPALVAAMLAKGWAQGQGKPRSRYPERPGASRSPAGRVGACTAPADRRMLCAALRKAAHRVTMLNSCPAGAVVCPAGNRKGRRGRLCASFEPPGSWRPFERNTDDDPRRNPT